MPAGKNCLYSHPQFLAAYGGVPTVNRSSLWQRILDLLEVGMGTVRSLLERPTGVDSVTFSIAFIALAAKLAKADGTVTRDEVTMFRRIFEIPPDEEANAARVYDLCRQDPTGYEFYARQMARTLQGSSGAERTLETVLDGLFHIAMADGDYHPSEDAFLRAVARLFGLPNHLFLRLRAQHVPAFEDPWAVLGLEPGADAVTLARARRAFLIDNHPDRLIAHGLPSEMIALANARLAAFNDAYDKVLGARAAP